MNNKIIGIVAFTAGAAIGSVATWAVLKTKYEELVQEEIQSVYDMFNKDKDEEEETEEVDDGFEELIEEEKIKEIAKEKMHDIISKQGYTNYAKISENTEEEGDEDDVPKPYVISPEEFDELDDYSVESLTLYADGVLVDEDDVEIDDIEGLLGKGSLDTFGQYEDDSVFVRNEGLKTDYEILKDERKYMDTLNYDE